MHLGLQMAMGYRRPTGGGGAVGAAQTWIGAIGGQSNARGAATEDGGANFTTGILEFTQLEAQTQADFMLDHYVPQPGLFGANLPHANAFLAANPGDSLILVPCAQGGTGFSDGNWGINDMLAMRTASRINQALADNPGSKLGYFHWSQGEADRLALSERQYLQFITGFVQNLRNRVTDKDPWPFLLAGLHPYLVDIDPSTQNIINALADVPSRLPYTGFVDVSDFPRRDGDSRHFNAEEARILGSAFQTRDSVARANTAVAPSFGPSPVPVRLVSGGSMVVDVADVVEFGTPTSITATGAGVASTAGTTFTMTDTEGVYTASVTATNAQGTSASASVPVIIDAYDTGDKIGVGDVGYELQIEHAFADEKLTRLANVGEPVAVVLSPDSEELLFDSNVDDLSVFETLTGATIDGQTFVFTQGAGTNQRVRRRDWLRPNALVRVDFTVRFASGFVPGLTDSLEVLIQAATTVNFDANANGRFTVWGMENDDNFLFRVNNLSCVVSDIQVRQYFGAHQTVVANRPTLAQTSGVRHLSGGSMVVGMPTGTYDEVSESAAGVWTVNRDVSVTGSRTITADVARYLIVDRTLAPGETPS